MEFRFNLNEIFKQPVVELGNTLIPPGFTGDKRALWDTQSKVTQIVNAMGEASANAQGLTKPITTADRLRNSEHRLYLLIDQQANNGKGAVTGMLKTGQKGLYVFDRQGQHYQVTPACVLDFYIHESLRRSGLGKTLFEHMLHQEQIIHPVRMAIDRPSDKLLGFLNKHYGLQNPVKQMNNYVVFDEFFPRTVNDDGENEPESSNHAINRKQSANGLQQGSSPYGRHAARKPPCSMGEIIHNDSSVIQRNQEPAGIRSNPVVNVTMPQQNKQPWQVTQSVPNMYTQNNEQNQYSLSQTVQSNPQDLNNTMQYNNMTSASMPQYSAMAADGSHSAHAIHHQSSAQNLHQLVSMPQLINTTANNNYPNHSGDAPQNPTASGDYFEAQPEGLLSQRGQHYSVNRRPQYPVQYQQNTSQRVINPSPQYSAPQDAQYPNETVQVQSQGLSQINPNLQNTQYSVPQGAQYPINQTVESAQSQMPINPHVINTVPQQQTVVQPQGVPQINPNLQNTQYSIPQGAQYPINQTGEAAQSQMPINPHVVNSVPQQPQYLNTHDESPQYLPQNVQYNSTGQPQIAINNQEIHAPIPQQVTAMPQYFLNQQAPTISNQSQSTHQIGPIISSSLNPSSSRTLSQLNIGPNQKIRERLIPQAFDGTPREPPVQTVQDTVSAPQLPVYVPQKIEFNPLDSEVDLSKGYPPQNVQPAMNSSDQPKADRPNSLNIEEPPQQPTIIIDDDDNNSLDNVDSKELEEIDDIVKVDLPKTENMQHMRERHNSPGIEAAGQYHTVGRNTPGLTDQGYCDLKFYHNKLW